MIAEWPRARVPGRVPALLLAGLMATSGMWPPRHGAGARGHARRADLHRHAARGPCARLRLRRRGHPGPRPPPRGLAPLPERVGAHAAHAALARHDAHGRAAAAARRSRQRRLHGARRERVEPARAPEGSGIRDGGGGLVLRAACGDGPGRGLRLLRGRHRPARARGRSRSTSARGGVTAALAQEWIAAHRGRPFFFFLHLYEPHVPYDPPEPFRSRYASPYDGEIARRRRDRGRLPRSPADARPLRPRARHPDLRPRRGPGRPRRGPALDPPLCAKPCVSRSSSSCRAAAAPARRWRSRRSSRTSCPR